MPDGVKVRGTAPLDSPWRTLVIGDTPWDLVESTIIVNLNDPCDLPARHVVDRAGQVRRRLVGDPQGPVGVGARHRPPARRDDREREAVHRLRGPATEPTHVLTEGCERGLGRSVHDAGLPHSDARLRPRGGGGLREAQGRSAGWRTTRPAATPSNYMNQIEAAFSLYRRLGVRAVKTGYAGDTTIDGVHPQPLRPGDGQPLPGRRSEWPRVTASWSRRTRWSRTRASGGPTRTS